MLSKFKIGKKDIELFGKVVGDFNPVHFDESYAAKTRFKTPISHGMVSMAMLNHVLPQKYLVK